MKHERPTICIIDDDKIYQSLTKKMLLKLNADADIIQFSNGKEAFNYFIDRLNITNKLPKVILLDINMPTMDGWEFLEEMSKIGVNFNDMEVYIVSSSIAMHDMEKAKANPNIMAYITKPIQRDLLAKLVL